MAPCRSIVCISLSMMNILYESICYSHVSPRLFRGCRLRAASPVRRVHPLAFASDRARTTLQKQGNATQA